MRLGFLVLLHMSGMNLQAADLELDPADPVQGGFAVLYLKGTEGAASAQALGRTIPLFPVDGGLRGLVPVALETPAGEYTVEAGPASTRLSVRGRDFGRPRQLKGISLSSDDAASLRENSGRFQAALARITACAYWPSILRRPVPGRMTARFGTLRFYGGGASWHHRGIDLAWPAGWPVVACAGGVARLAQPMGLYGNAVLIDHGQTLFTAYLHLTRITVRQGQEVNAGQIIGTVGETGLAKGAHLHFGAFIGTVAIDPEELFARGLPTATLAGN